MMTVLFNPELMIGVDIDSRLIKNAIKQMHKVSNHQDVTELIALNENGDRIEETKEEQNALIKKLKTLPLSMQ